ncbi:MAG: 50S ribosomal protein L9 [Weeping tea tree witches'-broom phytoplasma]|uniref:50S ribosomal protein L9 n=1 Tax=Candidatus Phytoplasma melaleucae TaxID=2982630 RepID=UPI0029395826|nr:50S ribosomal protein L9 [Weeping tea tree witches'-broom phytoplasma]
MLLSIFKKKNIHNYKKIILVCFLITAFLYMIFCDYDNIKQLFQNPNKEIQETKNIILKLFFSILGKIVIFFIILGIYFNFNNHLKVKKLENRLKLWSKLSYYINQIGEEVFNELPIGIIVTKKISGEIQWLNTYANKIFNNPELNTPIQNLNTEIAQLLNSTKKEEKIIVNMKEENFDCLYKKEFNVFYLFNVTEREQIKNLYHQTTPALVFLSFDHLENSLKNWDFSEQSQIKAEYLSTISDFIELYQGYLKQLSDDKFLLLLTRKQLEKMIEDKFSILKHVRHISDKYKLKITLSMGISCYNLSYNQLAYYAQSALELAQKRGGDQVVVNIENQKIQYFGATKTSLSTNSKVPARVNSEIIKELVEKHKNCFFVSHINPDLDALGSMIAFYKIAASINDNNRHYLIIDEDKIDQNFNIIYQNLKIEEPKLSQQIISTKQAYKIMDQNSLLVILDTQNQEILNSPELLDLTTNIVIIDHHRSSEKVIENIFIYTDSSASSTVEMLIELIYFLNKNVNITPFEASIMYGGMIIDTNYFTYRTNARTLEAAAQLINMGAEGDKVKTWLRPKFTQIVEINQLISEMEIYMNKFAIIRSQKKDNNRDFLAKVSDNALNIQNIDAAFAIGQIQPNKIGISARSCNSINVQMIMEQMNGGGHINSAATQIDEEDINEVINKLKNILKLEYQEGVENMKKKRIILLEDIQHKGKKGDIIEISSGYSNFLIKENKALLADKKNITKLAEETKLKEKQDAEHALLMNKLKESIENKQINLQVNVKPNGKLYGKITVKHIVDEFFEKYNILINEKKIILDSEINTLGMHKVNVILTKDIKTYFVISVTAKNNE